MISSVLSILVASSALAVTVQAQTPSFSSVTAEPSSLPLGAVCSNSSQCANGADCYGVSSFTIRTCGSFQSSCTSNNQCATNTCENGLCGGYLDPSLYASVTASNTASSNNSTATATGNSNSTSTGPNLPVITAAAGSLQVGSQCSEDAQCPAGVACYGTTAFTIKTCGSFNSPCSNDTQCSTNTCQNGFCSGFLASSLYNLPTSVTSASSAVNTSLTSSTVNSSSSSFVSSIRSASSVSSRSSSASTTAPSFVPGSGGMKDAKVTLGGLTAAIMIMALNA